MAAVTFDGVGKRYPNRTRAVTDFSLRIDDGEFVVLVGPSGCGKTTTLRMAAGLEEITEGELWIGNTVVNGMRPQTRDVAMVFQNYALYPHMTVGGNLAFPLKSRGVPKEHIDPSVRQVAAMLGLEEVLDQRPRTLSGGQRQRVAMGRALVRKPQLFLMDEPLSNLDAKLRVQMRAYISQLQRELGVTALYVTHDQVEAMTMGTRIVVMRAGAIQQHGSPQELYDRPRNLFVASFLGSPGMNLFKARVSEAGDGCVCSVGGQEIALHRSAPRALKKYIGREVALGVRPDYLGRVEPDSEYIPRLRGRVRVVETLGAERLVHVDVSADPVVTEDVLSVARDTDAAVVQALETDAEMHNVSTIAKVHSDIAARPGDDYDLAVDIARLHFFDLQSGLALE